MVRERAMKIVLVLVGLLFLAGVYPLATSAQQADKWGGDEMMLSIYVALGVFVLLAVRNPAANRSLIAFTAWSSFAHGAVMTLMAYKNAHERAGLLIAVAVLCVIGVALLALAPAKPSGERAIAGAG